MWARFIVQRGGLTNILSWKAADALFNKSFSFENLQELVASIGTDKNRILIISKQKQLLVKYQEKITTDRKVWSW